jgi:prepilin-type N-terminal cleavage/methylation domain-containing protein
VKAARRRSQPEPAFTLLELMIALVIIGILSVMLLPVYAGMRARAQRVQCIANLHSLYVATDVYLQRNGQWPQIRRASSDSSGVAFANSWIDALAPFGITRRSWICPTMQELLHDPDYLQPEHARLDYIPMNFDANALTPHKWPNQPWFIETGDVHGNGNLFIRTDGSVSELKEIVPK